MNKAFTDADYERVVRERDEALARVDSQRSQIAFYRTACTARFLPDGFGDETIRALIKELTEERDEARALVDELRGQYQYSVGLSMALEERDQARRERDEWRDKFHALNQTAGELCDACGWSFKLPGEPCRCELEKERDDCQKQLDEVKEELRALTVEHADESTLCDNALGHLERVTRERDEARATIAQIRRVFGNALAFDDARGDVVKMAEIAYRGACDGDKAVGELRGVTRQRDEARAEVEYAYREGGALYEAKIAEREAFRSGAEAMREACARWMSEREGISQWVYDDALSALPIPEEP